MAFSSTFILGGEIDVGLASFCVEQCVVCTHTCDNFPALCPNTMLALVVKFLGICRSPNFLSP